MQLQVPKKSIRSNLVPQNDPILSETSASKDSLSNAAKHQFQFQNTEVLPFWHFNRTQRSLLLHNPFTDYSKYEN